MPFSFANFFTYMTYL